MRNQVRALEVSTDTEYLAHQIAGFIIETFKSYLNKEGDTYRFNLFAEYTIKYSISETSPDPEYPNYLIEVMGEDVDSLFFVDYQDVDETAYLVLDAIMPTEEE